MRTVRSGADRRALVPLFVMRSSWPTCGFPRIEETRAARVALLFLLPGLISCVAIPRESKLPPEVCDQQREEAIEKGLTSYDHLDPRCHGNRKHLVIGLFPYLGEERLHVRPPWHQSLIMGSGFLLAVTGLNAGSFGIPTVLSWLAEPFQSWYTRGHLCAVALIGYCRAYKPEDGLLPPTVY